MLEQVGAICHLTDDGWHRVIALCYGVSNVWFLDLPLSFFKPRVVPWGLACERWLHAQHARQAALH